MEAICNYPPLWSSYFNNFIFLNLHLESNLESTIENNIIHEFFGGLDMSGVVERIVYLHISIAVSQLDLAKVATILRPLCVIETIRSTSQNLPPLLPSNNAKESLSLVHHYDYAQNASNLSIYVIHVLFQALFGCMYQDASESSAIERLKLWYGAFLKVMTLPSFVEKIRNDVALAVVPLPKVQWNIIRLVCAILHFKETCNQETYDMAKKIFGSLHDIYFMESGQVRTNRLFITNQLIDA